MDNHLQEFLLATQRCTEHLQDMIPQEKEKYQALISDDTQQIEEMVQNQQAAIMKLQSLEAARLQAQELAGFSNRSADEILELVSEEDRPAVSEAFSQLRSTAQELRVCNAKAMEIARASAAFHKATTPNVKAAMPAKVTYGAKGTAPGKIGNGSLFQTKI